MVRQYEHRHVERRIVSPPAAGVGVVRPRPLAAAVHAPAHDDVAVRGDVLGDEIGDGPVSPPSPPCALAPRRRPKTQLFGDEPTSADACDALGEEAGVAARDRLLNIDDIDDKSRPAHTTLLGAGVPICEHMTNLGAGRVHRGRLHAVPSLGRWRHVPRQARTSSTRNSRTHTAYAREPSCDIAERWRKRASRGWQPAVPVEDRFDVVPVRIDDERCVIPGRGIGAKTRRAIVRPPRLESGAEEPGQRCLRSAAAKATWAAFRRSSVLPQPVKSTGSRRFSGSSR